MIGDLGSFTLGYLGQTGQIASRSLAASNLATSWTYLANVGDRRLASVTTAGLTAGQSTAFSYASNAVGQTTGANETSDAAIAYPPGSLIQTASYDNLNQLTNLSGQAFTFDADGNLTSDGTRTYSWDAENRLIAIAYPSQTGKATTFAYDGLGRRIQWSSTPAGGGSATVTSYLWCGLRLCQARNAGNQPIRAYYAEGEFTPGSPGASYYYAPDRVGSVRRVFSSATAPAYDYDPYGSALQATAPTTDFAYAGLVQNPDSGLGLATHRPYDPTTGRFISRDPAGEAGDLLANLYAYVGGDPVGGVDPEGVGPAGSLVGGALGFVAAGGLSLAADFYTGGLDVAANPAQVSAGATLGAAAGNAIENIWNASTAPGPGGSQSANPGSQSGSPGSQAGVPQATPSRPDCPPQEPPPVNIPHKPPDPLAGTKPEVGARPPNPPPDSMPPWWVHALNLIGQWFGH